MRQRQVLAAAVLMTFAALAAAVAPAPATAQESVRDTPSAEAWFRFGGALPPGASTYPPGTLHVGVVAGQESDRTYLAFDVDVPSDATIEAAELVVPLDADAGTASSETAVVQACASVDFEDGATGTPPASDCARKADGEVAADGSAVRFDVASLLNGGELRVALLPAGGTSWHLAFDSTKREAGQPASLELTLTEADDPAPSIPEPGDDTPAEPVALPTLPVNPPAFALPPVAEPAPSSGGAIAEEAELPTATTTTRLIEVDSSFKYPIVFALPLLFLIALAVLGDGLTRPLNTDEVAA